MRSSLKILHITVQVTKCHRFYSQQQHNIAILGVPFHKGQDNSKGMSRAPAVLRAAGLVTELQQMGHIVTDYGDIIHSQPAEGLVVHDKLRFLAEVAQCTQELSRKHQQFLKNGNKVLTLGGDHSIVIGSVDAHVNAHENVSLLYVDAHADLNTADTSPSGNVHGMTVALLVRELYHYWPYLPGMDWQQPRLEFKNVAYIGLRSVDTYERFLLDKYKITAFAMEDVEKYGVHKVTEMALSKIDPHNTNSLHISFDIDSLDTLEAPSTGVPVRGGLSLREGIHIMEMAHRTGRLNAVDLVEINPEIGSADDVKKTVEAGIQLVKAAFGFSRIGSYPSDIKDIPGFYK